MYWLVGIVVITAMIGVLAVAGSIALPASPLLIKMATASIGPWLLIVSTMILVFITQRSAIASSSINTSKLSVQNPHKNLNSLTFHDMN